MPPRRIELVIEGLAEYEGQIPLHAFAHQIRAFYQSLSGADRILSQTKAPAASYRVVGLKFSSPAVITVEAVPKEPDKDTRDIVIPQYLEATAQVMRQGTAPRWVDRRLLEKLRNIASPVGRTIKSAEIRYNGTRITVDERARAQVDVAMAPEQTFDGSIDGDLEWINFHGGRNVFYVYPLVGPERVQCHFPEELVERAEDAVNNYVTVYGTMRYKAGSRYPFAMDVNEIEIMPDSEGLPGFADLKGMAPNATGSLSSVEFVRSLREEWEEE